MTKGIKQLLRRWLLTQDERTLLEADRRTVLQAMLSPEAWRVLASIEAAGRYQPEPQITADDAQAWETALRTPVGLKVDTAMINWLQQMAQRAIAAPPEQVLSEAKYALGCRAGWEMAKSLPRLAAAQSSKPEMDDAPTAAASLAQHEP